MTVLVFNLFTYEVKQLTVKDLSQIDKKVFSILQILN
jgi:hypothetical protein